MDVPEILLLFSGGVAAGMFGALFGIGGGVLMVPLLVIALKVPIHNAIATSLISVIATSSTSTARNLRDGLANIRLAVTLETLTVAGAIAGGAIAGLLPPRALIVLFAVTIISMSFLMLRGAEPLPALPVEPADRGFLASLHASYYDSQLDRDVRYGVRRLPLAMGLSSFAGMISGLLGVGGGIIKVPVLTLWCGVPIKAAAATSNFMIGLTATASVLVYFGRGEVVPLVTAACVLGVMAGSRAGLWLSARTHSASLRKWFAAVMFLIGGQMIWKVLH